MSRHVRFLIHNIFFLFRGFKDQKEEDVTEMAAELEALKQQVNAIGIVPYHMVGNALPTSPVF